MSSPLSLVLRPRPGRQRWVWFVPVATFVVIWASGAHVGALVAVLAGAGFLLLVQRRAATAASVLLLVILFNLILLSVAFKAGLSISTVKALAYWKEGIIAGCAVALWHRRPWRRLDALDIAAIAYVGLGTAYLLVPHLFIGNAVGSTLSFYARASQWKTDVLYVAVFFTFRHLRLGRDTVDRILERVLPVVVVVALIGILEAVFSGTWNHLAVTDLGVTRYEHLVVGYQQSTAFNVHDIRSYSMIHGHRVVRVGSVLFNNLAVGFVFALGLGTAAELVARGRARWWVYVSLPILGSALLLTQTRSAIIAGIIATLIALRRRAGKTVRDRIHLARILGALLVLILPFVLATGTLQRFLSAPTSNADHQSAFTQGVDVIRSHPMGRGLGTAAGGGQQAAAQKNQFTADSPVIVTESQYLQIGTQLGIVGLALYVTVLVLMLRRLLLRKRDDPVSLAPAAMSNVFAGALIGLLFTQAFVDFELAVLFWGLAGLAVGVVDECADAPRPVDPGSDGRIESGGTTTMPSTTTI
ncbi:MAG: O-antigen ligase family protein [Acidimicrobiales bacterium]